jgi:hypothetical protein
MRKILLVLTTVLSLIALVFSGCKGSVTETVVSTETIVSNSTYTQVSTFTSISTTTPPVITETVTSTLPVQTVTVTGSKTTVTSTNIKTETKTVTATPTIITNTFNGVVVFSYSGKGSMTSLPFSIEKSPWVFQFTTDYDGDFSANLFYDNNNYVTIVDASVKAWENYYTYVYNKTGINMYVSVEGIPAEGSWTIQVIQLT